MVVSKQVLAWMFIALIGSANLDAYSQGPGTRRPFSSGPLSEAPTNRPFRIFDRAVGESGEDEEEMETDRDSFTPATSVVGSRRLLVESAYSYVDNRKVPDTHSFPELIARYGLNDIVEIRIGHNYEVGGASSPISGNVPDELEEEVFREYEARLLYGAKVLLTEQVDLRPQSSLILQGFTPTSGKNNDTSVSASYVFGWKLRGGIVWDSALRYGTGSFEHDHFNTWSPSTVIKVPFAERWNAHAEFFSISTDEKEKENTQHFFSCGGHVLVSPDLEIGLRQGWGLNQQAPNYFCNVGFGYRF